MEIVEVIRRWQAGEAQRAIARASGVGRRLGVLDEPLFEVGDRVRANCTFGCLGCSPLRALSWWSCTCPKLNSRPRRCWRSTCQKAMRCTRTASGPAGDFSPGVRALLHLGHLIPGALSARGLQARRMIAGRVARLFEDYRLDALVAPASAGPAVPADRLDEQFRLANGGSEPAVWGYARVCWPANLTGQPALVLPITAEAPPLGVQLIGRPFGDPALLDLGAALEQVLPLSADQASTPAISCAGMDRSRDSERGVHGLYAAPGREGGMAVILESLQVDTAELELRTGWSIKPEGACKGEQCVPLPRNNGDGLDASVLSDRLGMPLVHDEVSRLWCLGPECGGRALASAVAPELTVAIHPCSIAALALAWLEQRLGIVQHQQAPPGSKQLQQSGDPLRFRRRRHPLLVGQEGDGPSCECRDKSRPVNLVKSG